MHSSIASLLVATFLAAGAVMLAPSACAQTSASTLAPEPPPAPLPAEYSDEVRRAYTQGLREARKLVSEQRYTEALARLDALEKDRPREPQARFLRAIVLGDLGRRDEAIVALRDLVADYPELPEAHNNLAVLYAAKGEYEMARSELALALAAQPDYAVAHENMGDVEVRLAEMHYERASQLDRANKSAAAKLRMAREIVPATAK